MECAIICPCTKPMLLRGTYATPAPLSSGFRGGCPGAEGATRPLCETYAAAEPGRGRRGAGRNCGARTCVTLRATPLRLLLWRGNVNRLPFAAWRDGWGLPGCWVQVSPLHLPARFVATQAQS